MSQDRTEALARLGVFVGDWTLEALFPGTSPAPPGAAGGSPVVRSHFEWTLDGQFLVQRTEVPVPGAPDNLAIVATDPDSGGYRQHYYDSRGVVRLYSMGLDAGVWTLTRSAPDFSPLDFEQRYTGTFSEDGDTITGTWEKRPVGAAWEHDFVLIYHRDR